MDQASQHVSDDMDQASQHVSDDMDYQPISTLEPKLSTKPEDVGAILLY